MARPLRVEDDGVFHHVLARGNERRRSFRDERDYAHFRELLGMMCDRFEAEVWSYVLMRNHYHLVLKPLRRNLSEAMQWLGVAYSVWHNRRHTRSGHLFQGRFKSFVVCEEEYLERLVLYVHRNPLRAGFAERLADYAWSSYRYLSYGKDAAPWIPRQDVLGLFGGARGFRRAARSYSEEKEDLLEDLRYGVFLGSDAAFDRFSRRVKPGLHREKPQSKAFTDLSVAQAAKRCQTALGLSDDAMTQLVRPIRGVERPLRDVLIYAIWKSGHHPLRDIGDYFGVGYTGIANAHNRGAIHVGKSKRFRAAVKKIT